MKDDVKVSMVIIFIITILILSIIPLTVHSDPEVEPFLYEFVDVPDNTFGVGDHWVKSINWPFFLPYIDWNLEYKRYSYSSWTDGNQYLTIEKEFNENLNGYKFNLILDVPISVYSARFTCAVNLNILDYVERDGWSVNLSYFNESFFFDWSDMANIPNIEFSKGIIDNQFWFRFKRDNIPVGVYEFDPIFGSDTGTSFSSLTENSVWGIYGIVGSDGTANNITTKFESYYDLDEEVTAKCALYTVPCTAEQIPYAITEEKTFDCTDGLIVIFNFTDEVCIDENDEYFITLIIGEAELGSRHYHYYTGGSSNRIYDSDITYSTGYLPSPSCDDTDASAYLYCSYTDEVCPDEGGCVEECIIDESSEIPTNKTTGVEDCRNYYNITVDVNDTCGDIDYVNITLEGSGYENHTSPSNGTLWYNHTGDLDCGTNYTWWVNTSCGDGSDLNNSYYWFTTEDCCDATIEDETPVNKTDCIDYNDTYINFSSYVNSSCDNTIDWVNISFGTNYSNSTTESEGLFWANFTGLTLVCNNNYTWYVNVSDGDGCNNHTNNTVYWFITCDCVDYVDTCPLSSNPSIANKSVDVSVDVGFFNVTIEDQDGNNTNGSIECSNGDIFWWDNLGNGTRSLTLSTLECETNITIYLNFTSETNVSCIINETYWFNTTTCGIGDCADCFNDPAFLVLLGTYLSINKYIKEDDELDINIGLDGTLLTLALFTIFFIVGYAINKRSGGVLMLFSGFILISFELVANVNLDALYLLPLLTPVAILIMILGVRKWLYPVKNEKTKSEGT